MVYFLIILAAFLLLGFYMNAKKKKETKQLASQGYDVSKKIIAGTYIGGHPDIDNIEKFVELYPMNETLDIYSNDPSKSMRKLGSIKKDEVKNFLVEDKSTLENRLKLGRVLLAGVFALAWKKKEKKQDFYLVIEWNDGKFDHSTLFEFEGKIAMQNANTARNGLYRFMR